MSARSPTGKTSSRRRPRQIAPSSCGVANVCGREATTAALSAPAEAPTSTSGTMPRSYSARSMPTCSAPRLAPPDRTNAVRGRRVRPKRPLTPRISARMRAGLTLMACSGTPCRVCSAPVLRARCSAGTLQRRRPRVVPDAFLASESSGGDLFGCRCPAAAERLVEVDDRNELIALGLCEGVLCRIEQLQGVQHLDVIREARLVPEERQPHGLLERDHLRFLRPPLSGLARAARCLRRRLSNRRGEHPQEGGAS